VLTAADDYPVHQRPEPIATAGSDRNFYDRYFFNARSRDGDRFLAAALGVYPHLNILDAAICWMEGGRQRSVFASRLLGGDRMDTRVGPIAVEVVEPLRQLRVTLDLTDGLAADLMFEGRHPPIEEPRFTFRQGPLLVMDSTRMTQNVRVSGWVDIDGRRHALDGWPGTRDRSWGIRPVGLPNPQGAAPPAVPQFFWLWAPLNFDRYCLYAHSNDDADGQAWNRSAVLVDLEAGSTEKLQAPAFTLAFVPGTRRVRSARLSACAAAGPVEVSMTPSAPFHMAGIGYGHPRFGHGLWRGPLDIATETFEAASADPTLPVNAHIQALVEAELRLPGGGVAAGCGVLEQLFIGPHAPSGFTGLFDAP